MKKFRRQVSMSVAVLALLVTGSFCGCTNNSIDDIEDLQSASLVSRGQELGQTMKYIESYERFEMNEFRNKVNSGLNRWMSSRVDSGGQWSLPKLAGTLGDEFKSEPVFTSLDSDKFSGNDANFLQQAYWIEQIARRVQKDYPIFNHEYFLQLALGQASENEKQLWLDSKDLLVDVVTKLNPDLGTEKPAAGGQAQVEQLARAMELFDWTVRNIQLLDEEPWPTEATIGESALQTDVEVTAWPPSVGAVGPGYVRYPWQTLTYGKGDYLDRAHIFALLCQAIDIPVAILATATDEESSRRPYREWLPAVLIGGQLYLFDTQLGLPIPGKRAGSIATLSDVVADVDLLKQLDLLPEESVEKLNYPVGSDDLKTLAALVVGEPESISKRMTLIQRELTGDARMQLVTKTDDLANQLSVLASIQDVKLWHVPFSINLFREQLGLAVNKAQYDLDTGEKLEWLADEVYIDNFVMFRTARNMYLRGFFETDRNSKIRSALSYYFAFMYTDDEISQIDKDPMLQESLGIRQGTQQDFNSWRSQLQFIKSNMALIRADSSFFLALAHFENGNPQPALNWLERLPELDNDSRWEPWRAYQKGRAFEAGGKYEEAETQYASDKSAQRFGSKVRARWMKQLKELKKAKS